MKILIVSFDKNLTRQLKEILKDYEVIDVKNGEEALSFAAQYFDVVIYDAISGAISEGEINHMYEQEFKDAKFIIMTDDLFPINADNLKPYNKVLLSRDTAVKEIIELIQQPTEEKIEQFQPLPFELEMEGHREKEYKESEELQHIEEVKIFGTEEMYPLMEQPLHQEGSIKPKERIAIVSFDSTLIESITSLVPENVEVVPVKSFRNLEDILKDKSLIVFDAISGLTAKRRLMNLSKDPALSSKPFVILIDELFSIDVEDIPLSEKYKVSRGDSPENIAKKIMEILTSTELKPITDEGIAPVQMFEELIKVEEEQKPLEEILESITITEEAEKVLELKEDIIQPEEITIPEEREIPFIPIEEAVPSLEKIQVEDVFVPKEQVEQVPLVPTQTALSAEEIKEMIAGMLREIGPIDDIIRNTLKETMGEKLEQILREEIKKAIESIPLENMIRELTYQALKERLKELIT
ncbi:hypothetical protein [Thermocrinis sp.]